ncbi:hypothetical protein BGX26_005887 [Mortierella sp. AD094]|nr:hypothetical protein BGX26_005887 [Mortierella sp. AD094]
MRFQTLALFTVVYTAVFANADPAQLCTDLPRVIPYDQPSQTSMGDLAKKLADEGSHLTPEDKSKNMTIDSFLQSGLNDKQLMQPQPQQATKPAAPPNPVPAAATPKAQNPETATKALNTPATSTPADSTKPTSSASKLSVSSMGIVALGLVYFLRSFEHINYILS